MGCAHFRCPLGIHVGILSKQLDIKVWSLKESSDGRCKFGVIREEMICKVIKLGLHCPRKGEQVVKRPDVWALVFQGLEVKGMTKKSKRDRGVGGDVEENQKYVVSRKPRDDGF